MTNLPASRSYDVSHVPPLARYTALLANIRHADQAHLNRASDYIRLIDREVLEELCLELIRERKP